MSFATAVFPVSIWDGTTQTNDSRYDDKSPDYVTGDQYVAEIIALETVVSQHIDLLAPVQNVGVNKSILSSDGLGLTYRSLLAGSNISITTNVDGDFVISATAVGGGGDDSVYMLLDGTRPLTGGWDAGDFEITAKQFVSDVATGTAPLVVVSTTVVTNLNADKLDGLDATAFVHADGSVDFTADQSMGGHKLTDVANATTDTDAINRGQLGDAITQAGLDATTYTDEQIASLSSVYAAIGHTHTASEITDFNAAVDARISSTNYGEVIDDRVAALFVAGTGISLTYDDTANTFTIAVSSITSAKVSDFNTAVDTRIAAASITASQVSDFSEAVDDRINGLFVAGTGIGLTYNDAANTFTVAVSSITASQVSDFSEAVDDRINGLFVAGTGIGLTYDDTANTFTVSVSTITSAKVSDFNEAVDDRINALFVAGSGIAYTYNDAGNTFTVALGSLTADWNVNGFKITGLGAPTVDADAATRKFVRQNTINSLTAGAQLSYPLQFGTWAVSSPADVGITLSIVNGLVTKTNDCRLSLSATDPFEIDSVESATVYLHSAYGYKIALYDTTNTRWQEQTVVGPVSISVASLANGCHDIFAYYSSGVQIETVAWTNSTTRATAIAMQDGTPVKSSDHGRRLLGTIFVVSGKVKDDQANRNLANADNLIRKSLYYLDNTSNTYNGSARIWRNLSNDAFVSFVTALASTYLIGSYATIGNSSAGSTFVGFSSIDSNTAFALEGQIFFNQTGTIRAGTGTWAFTASAGRHFHYLMQLGNANSVFQVGALMGQVLV